MSIVITDPDVCKLLERPDVREFAKKLAEVEPGYYSKPELGHRVAGADPLSRTVFYKFVDALVNCGKLRSLDAWHNRTKLRILRIEFDRLRELFAGIE
jgi:hypothetical protein